MTWAGLSHVGGLSGLMAAPPPGFTLSPNGSLTYLALNCTALEELAPSDATRAAAYSNPHPNPNPNPSPNPNPNLNPNLNPSPNPNPNLNPNPNPTPNPTPNPNPTLILPLTVSLARLRRTA